jgi:hypothetical protein
MTPKDNELRLKVRLTTTWHQDYQLRAETENSEWMCPLDALQEFANLVRADEREACVEAVRHANFTRHLSPMFVDQCNLNREQAVEAIRARGK